MCHGWTGMEAQVTYMIWVKNVLTTQDFEDFTQQMLEDAETTMTWAGGVYQEYSLLNRGGKGGKDIRNKVTFPVRRSKSEVWERPQRKLIPESKILALPIGNVQGKVSLEKGFVLKSIIPWSWHLWTNRLSRPVHQLICLYYTTGLQYAVQQFEINV